MHFLLSNCRFWLEAYRFDGFASTASPACFIGTTAWAKPSCRYDDYFSPNVDEARSDLPDPGQ
jgi:1,4-alpha-glucan branching enzyme